MHERLSNEHTPLCGVFTFEKRSIEVRFRVPFGKFLSVVYAESRNGQPIPISPPEMEVNLDRFTITEQAPTDVYWTDGRTITAEDEGYVIKGATYVASLERYEDQDDQGNSNTKTRYNIMTRLSPEAMRAVLSNNGLQLALAPIPNTKLGMN